MFYDFNQNLNLLPFSYIIMAFSVNKFIEEKIECCEVTNDFCVIDKKYLMVKNQNYVLDSVFVSENMTNDMEEFKIVDHFIHSDEYKQYLLIKNITSPGIAERILRKFNFSQNNLLKELKNTKNKNVLNEYKNRYRHKTLDLSKLADNSKSCYLILKLKHGNRDFYTPVIEYNNLKFDFYFKPSKTKRFIYKTVGGASFLLTSAVFYFYFRSKI
ncbi:hypothetical protein EHP00_663 [Ecytonucleospora hepatopenaei]|uniref:Uncharacterized protein n=1 Tax=Ecytonucleospora hepatopenaei TaxID=646526 RepID=A0A1W0E884_9MICR|nr:hypothetical protein EHP00_2553 [Ecytonucleospora hepatopenaei]OQS55598.1 hypothetical protein EHP00_663 [Ecytonucleospora hepatopenaei]